MVKEVNANDFQSAVLENKKPVLVDFWAAWCGPCKMLSPVVEEIAEELEGKLEVLKLNVDQNQSIAGQFGVMSIPTLIIFNNSKEVNRLVGFRPKENILKELQSIIS